MITGLLIILGLSGSLVFAADIAQPTPGGMLLTDFEDFTATVDSTDAKSADNGKYTSICWDDKDGGKKSTIKFEVVGDAAQCQKAIKVTYKLVSGGYAGGGWVPTSTDPKVISAMMDWSKYKNLSFWVKGNGTKQSYIMELDDKDTEGFRSLVQTIESTQWTHVVIPFSAFKSRTDWQPKGITANRIFDWPATEWQIAMVSGSGELCFDLFEVTP